MKNIETAQDKIIRGLRFLTSARVFLISLLLGIILIFVTPVILMTYVFWDFGKSSDAPAIAEVKTSLDKNLIARHYIISGGGAAGYVSQFVNIQPMTDEFDKSKGVVLQTSHSEITSLNWKENNILIVEYLRGGKVSLRREILKDINVKVIFIEK